MGEKDYSELIRDCGKDECEAHKYEVERRKDLSKELKDIKLQSSIIRTEQVSQTGWLRGIAIAGALVNAMILLVIGGSFVFTMWSHQNSIERDRTLRDDITKVTDNLSDLTVTVNRQAASNDTLVQVLKETNKILQDLIKEKAELKPPPRDMLYRL